MTHFACCGHTEQGLVPTLLRGLVEASVTIWWEDQQSALCLQLGTLAQFLLHQSAGLTPCTASKDPGLLKLWVHWCVGLISPLPRAGSPLEGCLLKGAGWMGQVNHMVLAR